jgi:hypothetical protein
MELEVGLQVYGLLEVSGQTFVKPVYPAAGNYATAAWRLRVLRVDLDRDWHLSQCIGSVRDTRKFHETTGGGS